MRVDAGMPPKPPVAFTGKAQATCSRLTVLESIAVFGLARVPARLPAGAGQSLAKSVSSGGIVGPAGFGVAGPGLSQFAAAVGRALGGLDCETIGPGVPCAP